MAFSFKKFHCDDSRCGMKISTDGVLLGAWAECYGSRVADIGAGSGLVSLMIAQRFPDVRITALEIDPEACKDAEYNISNSPWSERISVRCMDFADWTPDDRFDAVVSNPPFFSSTLRSPDSARALARHIDSGFSYTSLIRRADEMLTDNGILSMILPADCEDDVIFTAEMNRMKLHRLCRVSTLEGRPPLRILVELGRHDTTPQITGLEIRDSSNNHSVEYRSLTRDFYLNF